MKPHFSFRRLSLCALACCFAAAPLPAKPPAKKDTPAPSPSPTPTPAPSPTPDPSDSTLTLQNSRVETLVAPLAEVIRAASGKNVLPVDPANPADAAVIAKLGGVMDRVLPGMNKPGSPAHIVERTDEVVAFFEDAVRAFAATVPGMACPEPSGATGSYPVLRIVDAASGKSYYLGVTLYPTGTRDAAVRALRLQPAEAAARFSQDGACLLIAIESNGKTGKEIGFLNWELLDLKSLSVHSTIVFEASQSDAHPAGAVLNDGRKGRD